jgi:hypothetical protein
MRGGTDRIIFHISFDISHLSFELDALRATIIIPNSFIKNVCCHRRINGKGTAGSIQRRRDGNHHVGIYWNNHHHMLHATTTVTGAMLWANLHLLFWLSLFPFATGWMGENHFTALPTALYGAVLLMAAIAYYLLERTIIRAQGPESILQQAVGRDWKGKLSPLLYVAAIVATLLSPGISQVIFVAVALIWLIPDRRIESVLPRNR